MSRKRKPRPIERMHLVVEDGRTIKHITPRQGWDWFADTLVNDPRGQHPEEYAGVRWCYAVQDNGQVVIVYEGKGVMPIGGCVMRGDGVEAFIMKVNSRLGHSLDDCINIFARTPKHRPLGLK